MTRFNLFINDEQPKPKPEMRISLTHESNRKGEYIVVSSEQDGSTLIEAILNDAGEISFVGNGHFDPKNQPCAKIYRIPDGVADAITCEHACRGIRCSDCFVSLVRRKAVADDSRRWEIRL